jgi:hypothetical protein
MDATVFELVTEVTFLELTARTALDGLPAALTTLREEPFIAGIPKDGFPVTIPTTEKDCSWIITEVPTIAGPVTIEFTIRLPLKAVVVPTTGAPVTMLSALRLEITEMSVVPSEGVSVTMLTGLKLPCLSKRGIRDNSRVCCNVSSRENLCLCNRAGS